MDGTFLYPLNEKGDLEMGKLGTIKKAYDFTLNELKEILQDRFPDVAKNTFNVSLFHFNEDAHIKANSILIMGHVENAGNFVLNKTDDLSELLKQNKPDPLAATNRVVILRKGKRLVFDMRKLKQRVTLEAGDIIHVPHKFSFSK
ncbi:hypothetical protein Rhal01_02031 [Rubritalea halochordaticola]|uniref:Soluble ligand binding domain-containing protein n=2 Tax=Rubritalea halochordaticola TaxID=714537 RepID=A0ABP9UZP5_9BACT